MGRDPADEFAPVRIAGENGKVIVELRLRARLHVEAEIGLAVRLVGPVAGVADVRKNRPNVAVELDGRRQRLPRARRPQATGDDE